MREKTAVHRPFALILGTGLGLALLSLAGPAQAQPFTSWAFFPGFPGSTAHIRVPASPALNPTAAFTIEAWVSISNNPAGEDCRSIAGKNYLQTWWIGLCTVGGQPTLRSYLHGSGPGPALRQGGQIEPDRWTHVALVFNGTQRLHYINGELAASFPEPGPLVAGGSDLHIGSDVSWVRPPTGGIEEVRLWNVARSQAQIRSNMDNPIAAPQAGLVAVWPFNGNALDVVGPHDGDVIGAVGSATFPFTFDCGANTATRLCLLDRFQVTARWRTNPAPGSRTDGQAQVAGAANQGSGLFQFFSPINWEIMVKTINGCGLNNRYWAFSAATTNVFYRMEVFDGREGAQRIYFNYPGPPAPAVTDTDAFATCP